ncbi:hypothetical protein TNCV_1051081 [Trichonephila clavipes]|nr:hypothetical protein TNCV_1051081 [Trichonephila clavipes]
MDNFDEDNAANLIEEFVDRDRQKKLEMDSDEVQELLKINNQELTTDELIEMHEQEQDIEELQSLNPVQLEDRTSVGNFIEGISLIDKRF